MSRSYTLSPTCASIGVFLECFLLLSLENIAYRPIVNVYLDAQCAPYQHATAVICAVT